MQTEVPSFGYYTVSIASFDSRAFIRSNNERAFVISQLQDLLSPRLLLDSSPAHKQLASCIDLLAYSIRPDSIGFVVFAIDVSLLSHLITLVVSRLRQYQTEYFSIQTSEPLIQIKKLRGEHHALLQTSKLHARHEDWEYDRYSSIGFYLNDRRGDWMRIWRLSKLYENDPLLYRQHVTHQLHHYSEIVGSSTRLPFSP